MSPESERAAEAREWLSRAALDLRAAGIDLAATPPLPEDVLFHAQQVVEKSLKAFLVWHDVAFRKTHSLEELGRRCSEIEPTLTDLVDEAVPLTEYAWAFRYPGATITPERGEAEAALALARRVCAAIVRRLPAEAEPAGLADLL